MRKPKTIIEELFAAFAAICLVYGLDVTKGTAKVIVNLLKELEKSIKNN